MNNIILAFVGKIGSGKGYASSYLEREYGATSYRYSTLLRKALDVFYLPHSRENIVKISEIIRGAFGENILAEAMSQMIRMDDNNLIVLDGVRRNEDIALLQKNSGFYLVKIEAQEQVRYNRIVQRDDNVDDKNKTFEAFQNDQKLSTEKECEMMMNQAQYSISNNGSAQEFEKELDTLMKRLGLTKKKN